MTARGTRVRDRCVSGVGEVKRSCAGKNINQRGTDGGGKKLS